MVDRSVRQPVGILYDVLVMVDTFIFSSHFVNMECEVHFEVIIIMGRTF